MPDAVEQPPTQEDLVREVFIDPIRTVIVIDDEFPSIDALVSKELTKDSHVNWKPEDLQRVQGILEYARNKERPWLVDVHDARRIKADAETRIAPYLDHSDLMILDYHLDGDDGSGDASIKILRQLAQNGHHNLVILYTKGYPGDADRTLREIAVGLTHEDAELGTDAERMAAVGAAIDDWEDREPGIATRLRESISSDIYLQHRNDQPPTYKEFLRRTESAALTAAHKAKPEGIQLNLGHLVEWLFLERQKTLKAQFSTFNLGPVKLDKADGIAWLRTERLFVTLVPKTDPPDVFEGRLTAALVHSFPGPHRMLLARMRTALDEHGSQAQVAILGDKTVQTAWLGDFLNPSPADENSAVFAAVNRYWEALGDQLRDTLHPFSKRVRQSFVQMEPAVLFQRCGLDLKHLKSNQSILSYNRFISTKGFDRGHLTTGHIFALPSSVEGGSEELWVCLSPACDMVPGQKTAGWNSRLGSSIPFIAVRLFESSDKVAAGAATSNNYVFVELSGRTRAYSIYPDHGDIGRSPEWEQMFVTEYGRFQGGNRIVVSTTQVNEGKLTASDREATVVAQLRAEYALNLLQRMGAFLFRPGLGMHFKKRSD